MSLDPYGKILVRLSPGYTAASVEGIWEGLKVFAKADIDLTKFTNTTMRELKRTTAPMERYKVIVQGSTVART
ncbi:MAG: hypothetical protein U0175_04990 [Caldilineaceae bacterium]